MEPELLERALNFHGNDLLRSMAKFCGMDILTVVDPRQVTYFDFHNRFKDPKLEDDAKRYKILEFVSRKAHMLFKKPKQRTSMMILDLDDDDNYAVMPPLEAFMGVPEKERHKHFLECLRKGDVVVGVIHAKQAIGFILKLMCVDAGPIREIYDLDIKALCPINQAVAVSAHESPIDTYQIKDLIRCVVLEVVPEEEKIIISMKSDCNPTHAKMKLGLISEENLPSNYRKTTKLHGAMFETVLEQSTGFINPSNVQYICDIMGLTKDRPSLMSGLHEKEYDKEEYAISLRKAQAAKWALQSVADGISHFKAGRHTEAFQCLNKALQIDPENVEALVARGALFANNCNFTRALEDFELAIEINPKHHNARKYMVETLVALGRQHEDKSDNKLAYKMFCKALQFNPDHREANEAIHSLEMKEKVNIKTKQALQNPEVKSSSVKKEVNEPSCSNTREKLKQLLKTEKKEKKIKLRGRSSSSSSSSSTSSSASDSTSSRSPSPRSKSRKRSPGKSNSISKLPRNYKLNTREEKSGKYRDESEKPGHKKSENLMDFAEKMLKDKGKDISEESQYSAPNETTGASGLEFEELEARLNSYYEKFDTISDDWEGKDKRSVKTVSRGNRKEEEPSGRCPSPKVTFVMKADQMESIAKRYLNKTKETEPEDLELSNTDKGSSSMWVNNFKPLKLEERKTVVPINVFTSLEKQTKDGNGDTKKVNEVKKPGGKSLFLPPTRGRYEDGRSRRNKSRSRSRSRSRSYSRNRRSSSRTTPRAYRRSRSSSRSRRRSYSRSSSRSRRSRSYSYSRSRSRSYSSRSRSGSRSRYSRHRKSSYRSRSRSRSRSHSPEKYYSRPTHSDDHHYSPRRPFRSRASSSRSRPFVRGGMEGRGRGRGSYPTRPFRGRGEGRGRRRSGSSLPGIVTRAVVPYYKGETVDADDELAQAVTPEKSDDNGKSDGENKAFRSVEEVENLLKQHKAQKKAESLAKNKDIKKKSMW